MKFIHAFLISVSLLLAGCGTFGSSAAPSQATSEGSVIKTTAPDGSVKLENLSDYAAYAKSVTDKQPLFSMTCPPSGCVISSLTVNAPSDGASKLAGPPKTAGVAFTEGFFGLGHDLITLVPWYFGAKMVTKAIDGASGKSNTTTTTTTDNSNRSVVNDSSNRSTTTTTTTDNSNRSTNSSNNRNCSTGAPSGADGQTGSSGQASC